MLKLDITYPATLSRFIPGYDCHPLARLGKCTEELGEFAEATLVINGFMHKELKEPQSGEAADVIITVLDTYLASNPLVPIEALVQELNNQLVKKTAKWASKYNFTLADLD